MLHDPVQTRRLGAQAAQAMLSPYSACMLPSYVPRSCPYSACLLADDPADDPQHACA